MDLFTRIAKANHTSRGYGAGGEHADEMTRKETDMASKAQTKPILIGVGIIALVLLAVAGVSTLM